MTALLQITAVIFSMDGLLLDTRAQIALTIFEAVNDLEFSIDPSWATELALLSEGEIAQALYDRLGPTFSKSKFREHFEFNLEQKFETEVPVKPGVFDLLGLLHRKKVPSIVVAGNRTIAAQTRLSNAKILRYVQGVIGSEQVLKQKPAPDIFLKAAREMGSAPQDCLVLDGYESGIRAAHAAGMVSIMVPDGFDPSDELREIAGQICLSLTEVTRLLQKSL